MAKPVREAKKRGTAPQLLVLEPAGIMLSCFCSSSKGSNGDGEEVGALPEPRDLLGTGHATMQGTVRLLSCIATVLPVTGCFAV